MLRPILVVAGSVLCACLPTPACAIFPPLAWIPLLLPCKRAHISDYSVRRPSWLLWSGNAIKRQSALPVTPRSLPAPLSDFSDLDRLSSCAASVSAFAPAFGSFRPAKVRMIFNFALAAQ